MDIGASIGDAFEIDYIAFSAIDDPDHQAIRFGYPDANDQSGIECIPSLKSVAYRPQQISLAENIGVRASVSVSLIDHRDSDTGAAGDPYWTTRGYNPFEQGTFWGKFRARHKYMQGAELRYIQGTEGQTREGMDVRTFIVDKISGPSLDGKVTITAKDVLKLADDDKAQCPVISKGRLSADLTATAPTITLSPSGIGDTEYPTSGYVAIGGKEICSFTRSADVMTITRAQFDTTADTHKANDMVQLCKAFFTSTGAGLDPSDIIYDLLINYSTTDASWVTLTDWKAKTAAFINRLYYSLVAEPTSVRDLINELIEQTGIILFSDDISRQVRMDVVRELTTADRALDESDIMRDSFSVKDQPEKRLSQVWVYYGQRNPLEKLDDTQNYAAAVAIVDEDAEAAYGVPSIKKIYSRWIPRANRPAASDLGYRLLSRFRDAPRVFEFAIFRHQADVLVNVALAGRYNITGWPLQLPTGEQTTANAQVTELDPGDAVMTATAQELLWHSYPEEPEQPQTIIFDQDALNVNLRAEFDKSYPTPVSGDTVTFIVENDVVIGSSSTSLYALDVGSWPAGVTVAMINNGYIVGTGGSGGSGGSDTSFSGYSGNSGGTAIYARYPVSLDNNGLIGGGGGGGGGGGVYFYADWLPILGSGGGGGGAGNAIGYGGLRGDCYRAGSSGGSGALLTGGEGGTGYYGNTSHGGYGGSGGALGAAGESGEPANTFAGAGGSAGNAVDGNSYITWATLGDVRGARVN
ncbi:MAG: hypothetical protein HGB02_03660 [Chlorobiaceae bacterium]|nr:hypothetical protein [Chlorobiaceae bacterium]